MGKFCIFLIIGLSATSLALAEDCPSVDLENPSQTANNIPVWNQGDTPYCYLYAASFLATAWMRSDWSSVSHFYATYTTDPKKNVKMITHDSAAFAKIQDAENGRTCQSFDAILNLERLKSKDPHEASFLSPTCECPRAARTATDVSFC